MNKESLMLIDRIKLGSRVEIYEYSSNSEERLYFSQLETITKDKMLIIYMPISRGSLVKLPPERSYKLHFLGSNNIIISIDAKIVKYAKKEDNHFVVFSMIGEAERVQRRNFFRYTCLLQFCFTRESEEDIVKYDGVIKDLGGGGVRFIANEQLEEAEVINFNITLDSNIASVKGVILNRNELNKDAVYKYEYRLKFTEVEKAEQDKIVKYIFTEQRKRVRYN